jgi:hypothetical protein
MQLSHADNSTSVSNTPQNSIVLDEWQHVAVSYDGTTSQVQVYVGGIQQELTHVRLPSGPLADHGTEDLLLGDSAAGIFAFDGAIDEVRFWNAVRSADDIQENMTRRLRGDETGLVGYWPMNEGNGTVVADVSGHEGEGTIEGATWVQGYSLDPPTDVESCSTHKVPAPELFSLSQNYPNPFNPWTTIHYTLPEASTVEVILYDVAGRKVRTLVNEWKEEGSHATSWEGRNDEKQDVASGVYISKMAAKSPQRHFTETRKMVLIR